MRDKFSELIDKGIASFEYTNIADNSCDDFLCRLYNNLFSIPTDTHMKQLDDCTYVITGHMINTPDWNKFLYATYWGGMKITCADFCHLADFLYQNDVEGEISEINGDTVYVLKRKCEDCECCKNRQPKTYTTTESSIPRPLTDLITDSRIEHIWECLAQEDPIEALNKNSYILGNHWINYNNEVSCKIRNKVVKINI